LAFPGAPDSNAVFNNNGVRYGVYYGAMFQAAQHWVFGVESDYNFFNKTNTVGGIVGCATGTCPGFPPGFADASGDSTSIKTGNDFSLRARVGFLVLPDLMLYGTGGAAWQKITASATCSPGGTTGLGASPFCAILSPGPAYSESHTATLAGFTVGGGLEWKIAQHFLVRGEYRYSDYGTYHASFFQTVPASPNVFANVRVTSQVATFGIAYLIPPPKW
jgi:outer membrane immunogenic protein